MLRADASSLSAWLREASERIPRVEAEQIVAFVLGCSWGDLWSLLREPVDDAEMLDVLVERRVAGEPLAYITGATEFYGLELRVGPGVLVPRPETETLVEVGLELVGELERPTIVDVGTGSGAVAIALAAQRPDAIVWGTDISDVALGYARANAEAHGVDVRFVEGDLLAEAPRDADLVCSNPPYIPLGTSLPPDVAAEPREALFSGPTGDELLVRVALECHSRNLALEVGTEVQARRIKSLLQQFATTGIRDDLAGRPRVVWART